LIDELPVLPFDAQAARVFGRVRSDLERRGLVLGPYDMLIAAHALAARWCWSRTMSGNSAEFRI
jgi:tRNA(fMet)-specific endonuclease VapC